MEILLLILHYTVCVFLVVVILLQAGKGADIGAVFGGGGSGTVFGSRGAATFLSKLTTGLAIVFLITSISLASISRNRMASSILKTVPESQPQAPVPVPLPNTESKPLVPESQPAAPSVETAPSPSPAAN